MATKSLKRLGLLVGEWSYLPFHITTAKLPVELKLGLSEATVATVEFYQPSTSSWTSSRRNIGCWVILDQRVGDNGRKIETAPPLRRESNSKPLLVCAAERDQRWCPFYEVSGHELTSCGWFYIINPDKR
ncbi:hypothetical protein EVAR_2274_1 [Eumeta japonica]|uniref:Uncharacterized protein n=1 Tax=Eumeta variegata TaxID=151549 RepID=A0A4C1SIE5_EUMVA|nr:hypothetical protein EVAR_2274_1 [Eumeta japonica]